MKRNYMIMNKIGCKYINSQYILQDLHQDNSINYNHLINKFHNSTCRKIKVLNHILYIDYEDYVDPSK